MPVVSVREVRLSDRGEWIRMRNALWPGDAADHPADIDRFFAAADPRFVTFVAEEGDRIVGFLELSHRTYANGCTSSPVPFVEGWYVDAGARARGVGRALMDAAEARAREGGSTEIASDALVDNAPGIAAHIALGYEDVERVVCLRKDLG